MRPLPFDGIVYSGHSYEPFDFTQQAVYRDYAVGQSFTNQVASIINRDARRFLRWGQRHDVPLLLGEFGCIGYTDGITEGPSSIEDCGKYADAVHQAYVQQGIGVTWWSLEKEKTIFLRSPSDACSESSQCPIWMPANRVINPHIAAGLQLRAVE